MSFIKALGWSVAAGAVIALAGCGSAPMFGLKQFTLRHRHFLHGQMRPARNR